MKKKRIYFLSVILIITFCIALSACDEDDLSNGTADDYFKNVNMPLVYEIYLDYMQEIGETPLTYEEWFEVVHGDEFQKGILPEIRKNDLTDFWEISYNNGKGWNDLRFKTETEEQKNCKHSFDKWIILCEGNDYCNGIRYRNCKNCNYKDYQFKLNDNVCLHLELETIAGTPATCTSEGLTDGKKCTKCGEVVVEQQIIPATDDHSFIDGVCEICGEIGETKYSEGLAYMVIDSETCYISRIGSCTDLDIKIPEYIDGYKVTRIGEAAFLGCISLTSIVIPDSVTSIDGFAFEGCSSLTSIVIPDSVTSIGDGAFEYCGSLTSIVIPNSVTSIGAFAFEGCSNLNYNEYDNAYYLGNSSNPYLILVKVKNQSITYSNINLSTRIIYNEAFYGCNSLTIIEIPDSVKSINPWAFSYCSNLVSVVIPDSVTSIGHCAFRECSSLTSIVIPDSVTSVGSNLFDNCSSLVSVTISKNITRIEFDMFYNCSSLTSIVIPDGVTSIDIQAFSGCSNLANIVIPDSVTSIGQNAFMDCSSLVSIEIPESITNIENGVFSGCSSLTSIVIPDSVTSIGNHAFRGCSSLTSIIIPDGVTSIGNFAFSGCHNLVYNIYSNAYYLGSNTNPYLILVTVKNKYIASCNINPNTRLIHSEAFYNCSRLTSIVIPSSITSIGYEAFYGCSNLTSIVIPASVMSIGDMTFYNCSKLASITVEQGNEYYHSSGNCLIETSTKMLILGCKNSVIPIDGSVTSIGRGAFYGCNTLTSITIPDVVTSIGAFAFWNCSSLTSIVIPNNATIISTQVFRGCSSLTSVVIPGSVNRIDYETFYNCSSLTSITFEGTKSQWIAISKGSYWNVNTGNYIVHCIDGDITK